MRKNNSFGRATFSRTFKMSEGSVIIGTSDEVTQIFNYIFSSNDKMREKNKNLLIHFHSLIKSGNLDVIEKFFYDSALNEIHPSLIKSAIIIATPIVELNDARIKAEKLLKSLL